MRRVWPWGIAMGLVILSGLAILAEGGHPELSYRLIQAYVDWQTEQRLRNANQLLNQVSNASPLTQKEYPVFIYDQRGHLREWNTNRWPLFTLTPGSLSREIYADEEKAYYLVKQRIDSLILVVAIPLWVEYKGAHKTAYFLGHAVFYPVGIRVSPTPYKAGLPLLYRDLSGQTIFRLYVGPQEAWLYPFRVALLIAGGGWLILLILWLHTRWRNLSHHGYTWRMGLVGVGVWGLLKAMGLPGRYIGSPYLHSESLAWGWLVTSAWDFFVLGGLLIWVLYRTSIPKCRRPWLFTAGYWIMWAGVGLIFWGLAIHSQLSLEPSEFEHFGEALAIGALVMAATGRFLGLWRIEYEKRNWAREILFSIAGLFAALAANLPWWSAAGMAALYFLLVLPFDRPHFLREVLQWFLIVTVINGFFSAAQEWRSFHQAPAYAKAAAFPRDLLLESRLQLRIARLSQDSLLWQTNSIIDNLFDANFIAQAIRKYFLDISEDYIVALSLWSEQNTRLDNQYELLPVAWQNLPSGALTPTISPYLFFVSKGDKRFFYTGRYPFRYQDYSFFLQIELYPRAIPLRALFSGEAVMPSYALYDGPYRVRVYGQGTFPSYWHRPTQAQWDWQTFPEKYQLYYQPSTNLSVILEYPRRNILHILASFPILTLIFAFIKLADILIRRPSVIQKLWDLRHRLSTRVRLVFLSTVVLPLLGLLIVSFLFFIRLTEANLEDSISRKLSVLHSYIQEERILSEKLLVGLDSYIPQEESYIRDLMRRLARLTESQVAIYTADGFLYSSTLSPAHVGIYVLSLLDPLVKSSSEERLIIRDYQYPLGHVTYGYTPLRSATGRLIGYIQVTFPASQTSLYRAVRGFLAYGVNVYLLLILLSTLGGLLLMENILRGLSILEAQVREAPPGVIPPRLSWKRPQDEIGTFVRAYNEMINRLEISQRELEMTLRQVSQQEMARQAAHEIKNALTPIKLIAQHLQRLSHIDPEKLHRLSQEMLQKIETLARIANRFLTFAGPHDSHAISLVPIHLNHFLQEYFEPYLQNTSIQMRLVQPDTPVWIKGHPDLLTQVLNNLIQNALQALEGREGGEITLSLEIRQHEAWIAVRDNGPGIPPEVQARMFEFYFTTKRSGTGLGLAISKRLVEQMQGRIFAETQLGQGTVFYVVFPAYMP